MWFIYYSYLGRIYKVVEKQSESLVIVERLKNGEKFGKLAKELSIDSGSGKKDGNLGYFTKGMMVKPFEEVAFKLQIGEISDPIKTEKARRLS